MASEKEIVEVELSIEELDKKYPILSKAVNLVLSTKEDFNNLNKFPADLKIKFSETQLYVANNVLSDLYYNKIAQVVLDDYTGINEITNIFEEFCLGDMDFSIWCETHIPGAGAASKILDSFYDGSINDDLMTSILKKKEKKLSKVKPKEKEKKKVKKQARNIVDGELIGYVYEKDGKYVAIAEDGKDLTSTIDNQAKLKYAFKNKGVVRGRLKENTLTWRVVKEKFINVAYPTLEEIEEKITREENSKVVETVNS